MNHQDAKIFNDSLQRCSADADFMDRFYEIFLSSSQEVRDKFVQTDLKKQKKMMLQSLAFMIHAKSSPTTIGATAKKHNRQHNNIPPHLYTLWLNSMIEAVSQTDPYFNKHTEQAWRQTLQPGINVMIKAYNHS